MTSKESLAYLKTVTADDSRAQEAIGVLTLLAETADNLAELHEQETAEVGELG